MFIAEKGLEVPTVEVDVRAGILHEEPWRSMNPFAAAPFLELDDVTGWFMVQVASRIGVSIPDTCPHAARWRREVADRSSARA